ncbi:unnamed protein product (macronuclear) [Paramecium tetraurelia]|uniref:Aminotransferase class I/classII large domain-containing protein n=1 Tax=Paramecium tetraurelia TaxID=5888 RepID=A0BE95_PARTE|nr:uncharacterized protein GSPATT00027895001 [Paramecium tetraurelia]CAK56862.1 unnamed protein product [Paramecium tetraurelia]|eukprot:XP_001424260.1 hypothetical protein (macronuclear) [Paramecium tetraurelia strain d4-2]
MQKYPSLNPSQEFDRSITITNLKLSHLEYKNVEGKNLFERVKGFQNLVGSLRKQKIILYERRNMSPPAQECYGMDDYGDIFYGINFASADYLGLCTNEQAKEAAATAAQEYSVNSCGAPLAFGASKYYMQLKEELKDYWGMNEVILYSAGWLAGFGVIKGLIRPYDFVIMDELCHNCLTEGAFAATKNVSRVPHLSLEAMEKKLSETRTANPDACILVVTEGLFSMDSDYTDLVALQKLTMKYEAFLLIDCAHDFGCMGKSGKGVFEQQGLQDFSNVLLMSGGSKCLSTNVGWVACNSFEVIDYLKFFSSAYMFTNSVNPVQCATALAQLRILKSEVGNRLRVKVLENYHYMKKELNARGYQIIGYPSPILPLLIGNELVCRVVTRLMIDEGIHCNGIEYPIVRMGQARLRVNLQPQHTKEHLDTFIETFHFCFVKATKIVEESLEKYQLALEQQEQAQETKDNQNKANFNDNRMELKKPNL